MKFGNTSENYFVFCDGKKYGRLNYKKIYKLLTSYLCATNMKGVEDVNVIFSKKDVFEIYDEDSYGKTGICRFSLKINRTGYLRYDNFSIPFYRKETDVESVCGLVKKLCEDGPYPLFEISWYRPCDLPPVDFLSPEPLQGFYKEPVFISRIGWHFDPDESEVGIIKSCLIHKEFELLGNDKIYCVENILDYSNYGQHVCRGQAPDILISFGVSAHDLVSNPCDFISTQGYICALIDTQCQRVTLLYDNTSRAMHLSVKGIESFDQFQNIYQQYCT